MAVGGDRGVIDGVTGTAIGTDIIMVTAMDTMPDDARAMFMVAPTPRSVIIITFTETSRE
jgi:hypothetical protein